MEEKELKNQEEMDEELDLDALDQVAGGVGLRSAKKVKTTEISQDTMNKI